MPRSIWTGVIGFGMVSIPVKLYTATESHTLAFHLLHNKCQSRIKEMRWCPQCDKQVEWEDVEKGYEYTKENYVVLTSKDFEHLPLSSKNTIEITTFVSQEEVDPIYFDKSYYLDPDKGAGRAYALLRHTLDNKEMFGIGKITLRSKERLCALRSSGKALVLCTLLYPDEIRENPADEAPAAKISKQEQEIANSLVDLMTESFNPDSYKDTYREALMQVIEAKIEGEEIVAPKKAKREAVSDLMAALQASVNSAGTKSEGKAAAAKTHRATKRKTTRKASNR